MLRGIPLELGRGRAVSAYADDVTVMVSDTTEVEVVGTVLKEYEAVTGAKINFGGSLSGHTISLSIFIV